MTGGDLVNESPDPAALSGLSSLTLIFTNRRGGCNVEVAGRDSGPGEGGYGANFALNTLQVGTETAAGGVKLYDATDNRWDSTGPEAIYTHRVLVRNASVLEMNGLSVYAREFSVDAGSRADVQGGSLAVSGDVEALLDGYVGTRVVDSRLSPLLQLDAQYDPGAGWTSVLAVPKPGVETRWQHDPATPGAWSNSANWTNGLPDASHVNVIDNGGTAEMTTGTAQVGKFLYLGYDAAGSGNLLLGGSAQLSPDAQYVGYRGIGRLGQTAGTNTVSGGLYLGYHSQSAGTYELAGTGKLQAKTEYVGRAGTGTLRQTGGENTVAYLYVGDGLGSQGTYEHTGGKNNVTEKLFVGLDSGSEGTYLLSGTGQLSVRVDEYIGFFGRGTFLQTGGMNSAEKLIIMRADPQGTYRLGGTGQLTAEYERLSEK
jgi:hypothetical protein